MNLSNLRRIASPVGRALQRRNMGGWLKTNIRTEENAGLREISYKTWEFDSESVPRLLLLMVIPGAVFYFSSEEENLKKMAQIDSGVVYGVAPVKQEDRPKNPEV